MDFHQGSRIRVDGYYFVLIGTIAVHLQHTKTIDVSATTVCQKLNHGLFYAIAVVRYVQVYRYIMASSWIRTAVCE